MIAAKSFEFLCLADQHEDSAVTDLDFSDGSESPPDYEEVHDVERMVQNVHNEMNLKYKDVHNETMYKDVHNSTMYSKSTIFTSHTNSSADSSLDLNSNNSNSRERILASTVFCIHRMEGCSWMGQLGKLKGHLNTCKKDAIFCVKSCGARIARVNMEDHVMYTCPNRVINCAYCKKPFSSNDIDVHQNMCGFEPLYCENKCGQRIARNRLKAHMVNTCSKRVINCKYCVRTFSADALQAHQILCPKFLVPCPNRCGENCRREEMERHLIRCQQGDKVCPHKNMGCAWSGHPSVLDQHLLDNKDYHMNLMVQKTRSQAEYIDRLKQELERANINKDGILVWRIKDFEAKMEEAKNSEGLELVSLPFYTSSCGYKLQASLFLAGNGAGEGTHMSIYIKVLPGDYDNILKWPFKHTISFTLIDQDPCRQSAVNIVESFIPDPNWANFARASTVEDPDQLGFGFPKFVPHGMLDLRQYVKDDTLFIKLRADPNKGVAV